MNFIFNRVRSVKDWTLKWFYSNAGILIIGAGILIWLLANGAKINFERQQAAVNFSCQQSCFPKQYEYIYVGNVGACWCYLDESTLEKQK